MASPSSVTCSGSISSIRKYPSDSDQENKKDQRKWKQMLSNRESARRSQMRKQKYLDDLLLQVAQLRAENIKILTDMKIVIQIYLNVKSQNEVLRAQMCELNHRLWALNDIVNCINSNRINTYTHTAAGFEYYGNDHNSDIYYHVLDGANDSVESLDFEHYSCEL